jgi:beta-glucosidase
MNRRDVLKLLGAGALPFLVSDKLKAFSKVFDEKLKSSDFGNFTWGVASAAFQIEGAWNEDGKGPSIWDKFCERRKIKDGSDAKIACDSYHRYKEDVDIIKKIGFGANRFSISWPRIFPNGTGEINSKGVDYYNRVIDYSLENGVEPWLTLYHWDLPQSLQEKGGWTNRDITNWFNDYAYLCAKTFGDRVNKWIVLNEPMAFVGLGYGTGYHAPGVKGIKTFFSAAHNAVLCQANGGRILRENVKNAKVGTAFSCSPVDSYHAESERDIKAARRVDALLNRIFVEPAMGMGYPTKDLPFLSGIEKYILPGDENLMKFDFDFIGIQHYYRIIAGRSLFVPALWARQIPAKKRHVQTTEMDWEIYPDGIYRVIKQFSKYPVKELIITENGAAFKDILLNNAIDDQLRIKYFNDYLEQVLKAKKEGMNVTGYFVWSLLDNFEWSEGYQPKFGLVYVDHSNRNRIIKNSGKWFSEFLKD